MRLVPSSHWLYAITVSGDQTFGLSVTMEESLSTGPIPFICLNREGMLLPAERAALQFVKVLQVVTRSAALEIIFGVWGDDELVVIFVQRPPPVRISIVIMRHQPWILLYKWRCLPLKFSLYCKPDVI